MYFLVPKKMGEISPVLDIRILDHCVAGKVFRKLTIKQFLELVLPVHHRGLKGHILSCQGDSKTGNLCISPARR